MPTLEIIKAWKDEEYRDTLTLEQRGQVPEHPSGAIEFEASDQREDGPFKFVPVASFFLRASFCGGGCQTGHCTLHCKPKYTRKRTIHHV
jgi:mersacidin/lichenicidin family type 2 lantibiotic